jgi:hypothetical protein
MHRVAHPPAARPALEVADLVRDFGEALRRAHVVTPEQAVVLRALVACRTPALGGHVDVCDRCGLQRPSYNSCRNRHCPKCPALAQARWLDGRAQRILPVGHFHVVFTAPDVLHRLAAFRREEIFNLIFSAASETLRELAETHLHAELGTTLVLHTWTRDLRFHPHVHAIVSAGGLSTDGERWVPRPKFLFHVRVIGALFRGKFLAKLRALHQRGDFDGFDAFRDPEGFDRMMARLAKKRWVVYAKEPFGAVSHVLGYLGRYTHRVGISNQRLLERHGDMVVFATKNGATATLHGVEFLRRFVQHVLPKHFVKIRHYGLYASSSIDTKLAHASGLLTTATVAPPAPAHVTDADARPAWKRLLDRLLGVDVDRCPSCQIGTMIHRPLPTLFDTS